MTGDLKPYPEYKDSGVPWLGKVPKHWGLLRLKYLFEVISGATPTGDATKWDGDIVWITPDDLGKLRTKDVYTSRRRITDLGYRSCGTTLAPAGSIAISTRAPIGHLAIVRVAACVNQGCRMLVPRSCQNVEYHYYQLVAARPELESLGQGSTFTELRRSGLAAVLLATPPPQEQAHIAGYLRAVDEKINRFIRNRRRLIEVLNEYKQAIINRYVTGQIDPRTGRPYPRYKPSGIDWLGDIPEHWQLLRIRSLVTRIDQGVSPQAENMLAENGAWGVLKAGCVNHGVFRPDQHKRLPAGFEFDPALAVSPGDVLVSRACGSPDLVGSVGQVTPSPYKLILSDKTFRLVFRSFAHIDFFVYAMNSHLYRRQVRLAISGAEGLANNLPLSSLRDFVLTVPPADEAKQIEHTVRNKCRCLDLAMAQAQREIDLIREYRTRLIADVVTGKLDVRGLAPAAGEEIAETDDWAEDSDDEAVLQDDQADLVEEAADGDT